MLNLDDKSIEYLRKKGIAKASKKMNRTASEGLALAEELNGEISIIEGTPRTASVIGHQAGVLLTLDAHIIYRLMEFLPTLADSIQETAKDRLQQLERSSKPAFVLVSDIKARPNFVKIPTQ